MSYTVNVSTTDTNVTATVIDFLVTITPDGDQPVTIVDSTVEVLSTSELSTTTIYTDAVELLVDDFANYFRGDWVSGTVYRRGELVNSLYSLYVCNTGTNTSITSTIAPAQDEPNWRRVVWKEAPFASLTVTNTATVKDLVVTDSLTVGALSGQGLVINSTATFNGPAFFNNTATFERIKVAGVLYPTDQGEYGQVLVTRGSTGTADWFNLGDLVFWSLSNNLYTNGFNIYTNDTNETLKIGASAGNSDSQFDSVIAFNPNNTSLYWTTPDEDGKNQIGLYNPKAQGRINLLSDNVNIYGNTFARMVGQNTGEVRVDSSGVILKGNRATSGGNVNVYGQLILNTGITFPDGTTATTAITTATATKLGGIKVGTTLNINSSTGVLNANTATSSVAGIVRPSIGLSMAAGGTLNANLAQYDNTTSGDLKNIGMLSVDSTYLTLTGPDSVILTVNTTTLAAAIGQSTYTLPVATTSTLGGVKIDGETITINGSGVISSSIIPATTATLGTVRIGANIDLDDGGTGLDAKISVSTATSSKLGLVKVGTNINLGSDATISLNTASTANLGLVKVDGTSITINHLGIISSIDSLATMIIKKDGYTWTNSATTLNFVGPAVGVDIDTVNDVNIRIKTTFPVKENGLVVQIPGLPEYSSTVTNDLNFTGAVKIISTSSVDSSIPWSGSTFIRTTSTIQVGVNTKEDGVLRGQVSDTIDFTGSLVSVSTSSNTSLVNIDIDLALRNYTGTNTYAVGDQVWFDDNLWTLSTGGTSGAPGSGTNWIKNGQPGSTTVQGTYKVGTGLQTSGVAKDNVLNLSTATEVALGGIKIGPGLAINPSTGVVSVSNTASITDLVNDLYLNDYALKYYLTDPNSSEFRFSTATTTVKHSAAAQLTLNATTSSLTTDGARLDLSLNDSKISNSSNTIRMQDFGATSSLEITNTDNGNLSFLSSGATLASKNSLTLSASGAVTQFGSSIRTSATTIVITGTNIDVNGSTVDITASTANLNAPTLNVDSTNLDIDTTNFAVQATTANITATNITLDSTSLTITAATVNFDGASTLGNTLTELTLQGSNILAKSTGYTRIGNSNTESYLYVQRIYNYAGNFAPFFPAGVQFNDNTVQITAWKGYDQGEL